MSDLYKRNPLYQTLSLFCEIKDMSVNAMCKKANISAGLVTDLKMGRKQTIQMDTATKIACALDTSVSVIEKNPFRRGVWDVDTTLKWFDCDSDEDRAYILENYGVDMSFFKGHPEDRAIVDRIVIPKSETLQKEKPTGDADGQIPFAERRAVLSEGGVHIYLDAGVKLTDEQLDDILDFIKFQQRKNGR